MLKVGMLVSRKAGWLAGVAFLASCGKPLPVMSFDAMANMSSLRGPTVFSGWAAQRSGIREVSIYLDGKKAEDAEVGIPRPDIEKVNPTYAAQKLSGWRAVMDVSTLPVGLHYVTAFVKAKDGTFTQQTIDIVVAKH